MASENIELQHSKLNMVSYGFGKFVNEFFNYVFGAYVFFYYETEIGLASWMVMVGYILFAIYNAVNDPFIGYLTDRPFKFTKRWGRRFPWVFIGGVPWILSYILIFTPPVIDPVGGAWIIFIWLMFTTCLYDTFASFFNVSFYSIFPDKFRTGTERRTASTLSTSVGVVGVAMAALIPSLFIKFDNLQSYLIQAGVVVLICAIALALAIPGCKEDQERIDCYLEKCEEGLERGSFFKEFKETLKYKNFLAFIIAYTFYQSLVQLFIGSIPYVVQFVLREPAEIISFLSAAFLIGALIGLPIWAFFANKYNNDRKTIILAAAYLSVATLAFTFVNNVVIMFVMLIIWGFGLGGFWVMMSPILADTIDESIIISGQRKEGIFNGIQTFVGRAAFVAQAVSFATIHMITNFAENASSQTPIAILGIQIHFGFIPAVFMGIAMLIMIGFYNLTPVKVTQIKKKIIELAL